MTYLGDLIADMRLLSDKTLNEWSVSGGNYIAAFINNDGIDIGSSCNLLYNGLMRQYEQFVRSGKLGIPAGALSFTQTPLPDRVEAYYKQDVSIDLLSLSMTQLYNIYQGIGTNNNGEGFKEYIDYLDVETSNGNLSNLISQAFTDAQTSVNTVLTNPLSSFVSNNQTQALEVFDDLQTLVVLLKNDLKTAIGLTITYVDSDGD